MRTSGPDHHEECSKLSIIVTVHFTGDPERADEVLRKNPDIGQAVKQAIADHRMIGSTRYVGSGEFLDVDEWATLEDRNAFLAQVGRELRRWNELAGITAMKSTVWRPAAPEEDF